MEKEIVINIAVLTILFTVMIFIWKQGYKKQAHKALLIFVIQAEKAWGRDTGKIKFADVYSRLPISVKLLFSQNEISEMIESAVKLMKEYLIDIVATENSINQ